MDKLEHAINAIRTGSREEGIQLLIEVARSDPGNETAWLWLGATLTDPQKQKDCLERVLQINPDNQQAAQMLEKLNPKETPASSPAQPGREAGPAMRPGERPAPAGDQDAEEDRIPHPQPAKPPAPAREPTKKGDTGKAQEARGDKPPKKVTKADREMAEKKVQRALTLHMRGETSKALKTFIQGLDLNPALEEDTFTRSVASELTGLQPDQALGILLDPEDRKEFLNPPKEKPKTAVPKEGAAATKPPKPKGPHQGIIQVWLSFFQMSEDFLAEEKDHANKEDTFLSVLVFTIAAVVIFIIIGFVQFQRITVFLNEQMALMGEDLPSLNLNIGVGFLFFLISTLIMTPLSFFIGAGLQYLGARLFRGSGDFWSHTYLLAVIQVPFTVLGGAASMLSIIPFISFVGGLVGFGISIFTLIITVRAVKAVHGLGTGRAVAAIIAPPLILIAAGGCLTMIFWSSLLSLMG